MLDLAAAGHSDDLGDTVDYAAVIGRVVDIIAGPTSYQLLESLAGVIAAAALVDPRVQSVSVTVRKLRPPVPAVIDSVGVRVTRSR